MGSRTLVRLGFVVLAAKTAGLGRKARKTLQVKDLAGQRFVDWLRSDPYGGANTARFEAAGIVVNEVARVESMRQLYPCLQAYRACAIAPDLRPFEAFPSDLDVWPLREPVRQEVCVVALWPASGLRREAASLLDWLEASIARRK